MYTHWKKLHVPQPSVLRFFGNCLRILKEDAQTGLLPMSYFSALESGKYVSKFIGNHLLVLLSVTFDSPRPASAQTELH